MGNAFKSAERGRGVLARPGMELDLARAALARRARLVERDVAVATDAEDLQIDPARVADLTLIVVARRTMGSLGGDAERRVEPLAGPTCERVRVIAGKIEILVEVERLDGSEVDALLRTQARDLAVDAGRRAPRRESDDDATTLLDERDDLASERDLRLLAAIDDDRSRARSAAEAHPRTSAPGSSIQNRLPSPDRDSTPTIPPMRSTARRTIASPMPVPG